MPLALMSKPILLPDLQVVWNAFEELHRTRQIGWDVSAIQISEIVAWLDLNEIKGEDRQDTYYAIRYMDDMWVSWMRKKTNERTGT